MSDQDIQNVQERVSQTFRDDLTDPDGAFDPEAPYNAGDAKAVKEKGRAAKRSDEADKKVIRQIMGSNEGRDWMNRLLLKTHVSVSASSPWSLNPLEMAKSCGEMEIGQQLLVAIVAACPERYIQMLKEANGERSS